MPKPKAEQYLREVMLRYRNKMNYNNITGEVDSSRKFMSLMEDYWFARREGGRGTEVDTLPAGCLAMNTKVSLLDGRELTISEIESEMKDGKKLWTYSCHPTTGEFAPGLISWAGVTQKSAKVMRITLDNGESIVCTLDHKFPIYDIGFVEAKDLSVGQSMIPLHRKREKISKSSSEYEMIYDNADKTWKFTHRAVAGQCKGSYCKDFVYENQSEPKQTIHHIDLHRFNNNPENLCFMGHFDHIHYHSKEITKNKKEFMDSLKETNPELYLDYKKRASEAAKRAWQSLSREEREERCFNIKKGILTHFENLSEDEKTKKNKISLKNLEGATQSLQTKLKDPDYNEWFGQQIRNSWTQEMKSEVAKRNRESSQRRFSDPVYSKRYKENHQKLQKVAVSRSHFEFVKNIVAGKTTHQVKAIDVCNMLNENISMRNLFSNINENKAIPNVNISNGFTVNIVRNMVKDFGYKNWNHFRKETKFYNHIIANIEYLNDEIEVGTLTIDSDESIHNYHTFALSCGVYTKNSNLGELTDLEYFKRNLYKSLNVPETRIGGDSGFNLGRSTEILRDEVKFTKFVGRLRKRFSQLFIDLLGTQLQLKNIVTPEDWKKMAEHIQFDFLYDNHFAELKESELFTERLNMVTMAEPYVGRYFSQDYLRRKILRQTDEEIIEQDEIISKEIKDGIIPDPNAPIDPETGLPLYPNMAPQEAPVSPPEAPVVASQAGNNIKGQSGKVPIEPKMPKGGEI
jgi:ribosomal protein S17E